ncbi:unnamed protein product (macronuclear) [Paramecium tetraurelia]|uniref:GAF domain-containing protein n=1 Tax=Paramecium tetraurelia TaxID=5888 RepID=A0DMD2_PARTE|nr:uncharacterized protein GSPATT00018417001 [Paramecium tetraurelia]CAK84199.1 unnamed protein product [Paramecium tetraurelia]|eukprot:XP_001451596.1 hypothetical protein (macronuclear) [Paramecium tetraurelia strain d4-2]
MKHSQLVHLLSKQPQSIDYLGATQMSTPRANQQSQQTLTLPHKQTILSTAFGKEQRLLTEGNEDLDIQKIKDLQNRLISRCTTLEFLIQVITTQKNQLNSLPTIQKIEQLLLSIVNTIQNATKNEIQIGFLNREQKKTSSILFYSFLVFNKQKFRKEAELFDRNKSLQQEVEINSGRNNKLIEDNFKLQKQLKQEKNLNEINVKKINALEKRIEFIVSNDINIFEMRSNITILMKENEQLKRDLERKNQEVERIQGKLNQYQLVVSRLQKTIDNLRKKNEDDEVRGLIKKDDIELLMNFKIPQNLDFRIVCQKLDHQNLLNDLCEKGVVNTLQQISQQSQEVQKQQISYYCNQLLSYKDFSERLNQLLLLMEEFSNCQTIEDLIFNVNRQLPQIFKCETAKLWLLDTKNGLLYSYLETRQQIKALQDKGMVADTFKLYQAQNIGQKPKKAIIYRINESEQPEFGKSALILPIFCIGQNVIRGSLIILNSEQEQFSFDEEYFGIIISSFLGNILQRLVDKESWLIAQKYRSLMNHQLTDILRSQNKQTATERIKLSFKRIFGFQMIRFYFVENEQLLSYENQKEQQFSLDYGLAGMAARNKQRYIVNDIKRSVNFNPKVDLTTILPIFVQPLLNKEDVVIGVVETCLKNKLSIDIEREHLLQVSENLFGIEEPLTSQLQSYVELLAGTLSNIKF